MLPSVRNILNFSSTKDFFYFILNSQSLWFEADLAPFEDMLHVGAPFWIEFETDFATKVACSSTWSDSKRSWTSPKADTDILFQSSWIV